MVYAISPVNGRYRRVLGILLKSSPRRRRLMLLLKRGLVLAAVCLVLPSPAGAEPDVGATVARLDVPGQLRAVSYYPADAGWTQMWEPWRPSRIAADLRRLRSLNANTVRVVVPAHFFGYPKPEQAKLRLLRELVGIAARRRPARAPHAVRLVGRVPGHRGVEAVGPRRAHAVRRRPTDRVRRAEERARHDGRERRSVDARARSLAAQPAPTPDAGDGVGRRERRRRAELRPLVAALPAARSARLLHRALLHRRRRSGRARLRDTARPGRADTAVDRRARLPDVDRPTGFRGVPLTPSGQEAAQEHYFKLCFGALARLGLPAPGLWILDDFAAGAIPASDVHERSRVPVRPLS